MRPHQAVCEFIAKSRGGIVTHSETRPSKAGTRPDVIVPSPPSYYEVEVLPMHPFGPKRIAAYIALHKEEPRFRRVLVVVTPCGASRAFDEIVFVESDTWGQTVKEDEKWRAARKAVKNGTAPVVPAS